MGKIIRRLGMLLIGIVSLNCDKDTISPAVNGLRTISPTEQSIVIAANQLGLKLFQQTIQLAPNQNVILAPFSISLTLATVVNGLQENTRDSLLTSLGLTEFSLPTINENYQHLLEFLLRLDPKVQMEQVQGIWHQNSDALKPEFVALNQMYFKAKLMAINLQSSQALPQINNWINENTHGRISGVRSFQSNPRPTLFWLSAAAFKGIWTYQFDQNLTLNDWFTTNEGIPQPCKMMRQLGKFNYLANARFQAVDLPYGDGRFRMILFLPTPGTTLAALASEFTPEHWQEWKASFSPRAGDLSLPKLRLDYEIVLNDVLPIPDLHAFLSKTDRNATSNAGKNEIRHQILVEISEAGTEAPDITNKELREPTFGNRFTCRVNRPFIFVIQETSSQTLLFIGKVTTI
ncbi:serpin family protein [candidate division KSB1 bacterium]|nr:serpin family protein [candidate division KSB1 bacterium]